MAGKAKVMGASSEAAGEVFPSLSGETARQASASKSHGDSAPLPSNLVVDLGGDVVQPS